MSDEIVVQDREELIFLLSEAAEFEHTVMCTYLYAMWSLKREADDTCTAEQLEAVERWRGIIRRVALEEMLHLALVNNILASLGAAPHLGRPAFPVPAGRFPEDVVFSLRKLCAASIAHFAYIERPEGVEMEDGAGFDHPAHYVRVAREDLLTPMPQDYGSQGHLYHGIARALHDLVVTHGEEEVFVGHGDSQVTSADFRLPGLFEVTDLASAVRAIEEIVVQGEGAPAHSEASHYALFMQIGTELAAMTAADPAFEPAHDAITDPALTNPVARPVTVIADPLTVRVVDVGDALYVLMMRTLAQVFSPSPLPRALRQGLANASAQLMVAAGTAAELAASLPAGIGEGAAGSTGGLTLNLPGTSGQLVQSCAAQILAERAAEIAMTARQLASEVPLADLAAQLEGLSGRLSRLHDRYETHISLHVDALSGSEVAEVKSPAATAADAAADAADPNVAVTDDMTLRFDGERCIHERRCVLAEPGVYLANVVGEWLHPEITAVEAVVRTAHACPSGAITYERHDGGPAEGPPAVNVLRTRENGPYGVRAEVELEGHGSLLRATLCRCGKSKNKPFCDNSHRDDGFLATGEPLTIESEPLKERAGVLSIDPLTNGPLQVSGNLEICAGTGRTVTRVQNCRLCRCGGSSTKPFCDNTHLRNGFRSDV